MEKWNNIYAYYTMDEMKPLIDELAKAKGMSPEDLMKEYESQYKMDFNGFKVTEDSLILYKDAFMDGENKDKEPVAEKFRF